MARIRSIKPGLFKHEGLFDAEKETALPLRVAFTGLWTQCDREGRFNWRPRALKTDILPYDDVDFSRVLDALATRGFIVKYACQGEVFGFIPSWHKHQVINNREGASQLPAPTDQAIADANQSDALATRAPRDDDALSELESGKERKGKEGNGVGADAPNGKYAYSGKVIHLTPEQYREWQEANPYVEFRSYLIARDAWLAEQPQAERRRWFISTSADLRNKNLQAKRAGQAQGPPKVERAGCLTIKDL